MGRYGEIWGDMGRYGEIWGDIPLLGAGNPMQSVHASASERSSSAASSARSAAGGTTPGPWQTRQLYLAHEAKLLALAAARTVPALPWFNASWSGVRP